jgi:Transcription elongation factor
MDKALLRQALLAKLSVELDTLTRAAHMAREEATSEESKSEHKYDMRGQEAAYLAEGQARLAAELQETITIYQTLPMPAFGATDAIDLGAVVTLENRGKPAHYFLGPRNGGMEIEFDGKTLLVVTPQSPLGRQLPGRRVGDSVQLPGRGTVITQRIVAVA